MTLGDITNDDPSLYPALTRAVTSLGVPWLHVPGNHDMDLGATSDADSLASFIASSVLHLRVGRGLDGVHRHG